MDAELAALALDIATACQRQKVTLVAAESCTAGWAAQVITHVGGSSAWFDRGFVTYSDAAKTDMLDIPAADITLHGAVSQETAAAMARGALKNSNAMISLAVTGIAGPTGGSPGKPVGTVCFAWCRRNFVPVTDILIFPGNREAVRRQAVIHALRGTLALIDARLAQFSAGH